APQASISDYPRVFRGQCHKATGQERKTKNRNDMKNQITSPPVRRSTFGVGRSMFARRPSPRAIFYLPSSISGTSSCHQLSTINHQPKTRVVWLLLPFLAFLVTGRQVLTYRAPTGERFTRSSL